MNAAELPRGTVTLLFTDIEGSTRLLKQLRDGYGEVLAEHRRLLRAAFDAHGGREIDTQGDAFFVAFPRGKDAVAAAVDAQVALAGHAWPDGVRVRVRMGVHTGEPVLGEEGYHGLGLHRGARICSAGHGGQILLSNVTRELIADEPLDGIELLDLGERHLKDIDRPERIAQVVYPGMPASFPPLKTSADAPFEGREEELAGEVAKRFGWVRRRRRGALVLAAALVSAAVGALLLTRDDGGPLAVHPNSLAMLSDDGRTLRASVPTGTAPGGVAIGEGSIWVTNTGEQTVSRVDPASREVIQTIAVGTGPAGVAVAGGFVWVANSLDGTVSQIDPRKAGGSELRRVRVGNQPSAIAAAGDVVWVANSLDDTLSRIETATGRVSEPVPAGTGADGIAVDGDRVWVTSFTGATVTELDPRTGQVVRPINVGHGPSGVAVAAGAVWVVNTLDGTVSKVDTVRSSVVTTVPVGREPLGVAARGNRVWVTDEAGVLTEIDARRATVVRRTRLGNRPGPLAIAEDGILVTVRSSGAAHRGGVLRVVGGAIDTLDSSRGYDELSWALMHVVGDGLVAFRRVSGTTGGQIVPDLAISLPIPTDGGRTWSFRLRRGVRYATGDTVRASDIRRGIERSFGPGAPGPFFFGTILGADGCHAGHCDLSRGIVTDDAAGTITFRLREPDPDLLYKLAMSFAFPAPGSSPARDVRAGLPGTGPYRVARFADERIVLERNPRFREHSSAAQPEAYPDRIEVRLGIPDDRQLDLVERGDADVAFDASSASPRRLDRLETTRASQIYVHPSTRAVEFAFLNTRRAPFDDVRARRAVNFAVDRHALLREEREGLPTCQVLPRDIPGYRRYCPYPHDVARARRLVAASGTRGAEVVVWSPPGHPARTHMAAVARAMRAVGYRARLRVLPDDDYFDAVHRKRQQAGFYGWVLDYPSPTNIVGSLLTCGRPENIGGFCDRDLDARIRRAARLQTTDQTAAAQLWAEIDRAITDRAPWVAIANFARTAFVSERVGNFQYHPQWGVLLDQLWVR